MGAVYSIPVYIIDYTLGFRYGEFCSSKHYFAWVAASELFRSLEIVRFACLYSL